MKRKLTLTGTTTDERLPVEGCCCENAIWDSEDDAKHLDPRTAAVLALGEKVVEAMKSADAPPWGYDYYLRDHYGFSPVMYAAMTADADASR